jgi:hypothetical protein
MKSKFQTEIVKIDSGKLVPHPENARRGNVEAIRESIRVNGFYGAVIAQKSTGYLIVGNHRFMAAELEGVTEIPVIWQDCTDDEARKLLLVDNKSSDAGGYEEQALRDLLAATLDADGGFAGTGYLEDDYDALAFSLEFASSDDLGELLSDARTPQEQESYFEASGIRSIILPYGIDEYNEVVGMFEKARTGLSLGSNADVVKSLLGKFSDG